MLASRYPPYLLSPNYTCKALQNNYIVDPTILTAAIPIHSSARSPY